MDTEHQVPIWFFIGALLLIYGVMIFGAGVVAWVHPPEHKVALWDLHADVWWGIVMTIVGALYTVKFWPFGTTEAAAPAEDEA